MAGVLVVLLIDGIHDPETYRQYERLHDRQVLASYGGELVVKSEDPEVLEGEWPHQRIVALRFPSNQALHDWYASDHYSEVRKLRLRASSGRMAAFPEFAGGA